LVFKAVAVFTEQLLELHRGQGMEIYWRDMFICPSEEQYTDTIVKSEKIFMNLRLGAIK
jgi:geranylgeranyl diphosphate synthase type 3